LRDPRADKLGIPMTSRMIDVDTSQTPVGFYHGSRGDLAGFNQALGKAWHDLVVAHPKQKFDGL
jgi:hypothetical protein